MSAFGRPAGDGRPCAKHFAASTPAMDLAVIVGMITLELDASSIKTMTISLPWTERITSASPRSTFSISKAAGYLVAPS